MDKIDSGRQSDIIAMALLTYVRDLAKLMCLNTHQFGRMRCVSFCQGSAHKNLLPKRTLYSVLFAYIARTESTCRTVMNLQVKNSTYWLGFSTYLPVLMQKIEKKARHKVLKPCLSLPSLPLTVPAVKAGIRGIRKYGAISYKAPSNGAEEWVARPTVRKMRVAPAHDRVYWKMVRGLTRLPARLDKYILLPHYRMGKCLYEIERLY